jgi:hypothetical protein
LIRAQVAKPICARHIRRSKAINDVFVYRSTSFFWFTPLYVRRQFHLRRSCATGGAVGHSYAKRCAPVDRSGAANIAPRSDKLRDERPAANIATCSESVLWACWSVQIAVQIALRAAAHCYRTSRATNALFLPISQNRFSTDCEARFYPYMSISRGINESVSTGSTAFSGLAPLCVVCGLFPQVNSSGVRCVSLICKNACYLYCRAWSKRFTELASPGAL